MITREMHKPISQSRGEVKKCALMTDYYVAAENVLKPEIVETELSASEVYYQPMGVILGNYAMEFPFSGRRFVLLCRLFWQEMSFF